MTSVEEYIDFLFDKLNELVIEDISYSDYDQMTDWLGEIRRQVKRLESAKQEYIAEIEKLEQHIEGLEYQMGYMRKYSED